MAAHWKTGTCLLVVIVFGARAAEVQNGSVESSEGEGNETAAGEILKASETSDPKKVDIVKQIRRLNDDGSYTVGYEAGDGTFKIESRDALGNVKGTFGYIDGDGEIKRVTYSSSNSSTPVPVTASTGSTTVAPAAKSVSSTTRRPLATVVYPRGSSSTRGTVIQPIPRKRPSTAIPGRMSDMETMADIKENTSETTTSNVLSVYKPKLDETLMKPIKMPIIKQNMDLTKEVLQTRQTSTERNMRILNTVKPVYEHATEKDIPNTPAKVNQFRRQLTGTSHDNPQMLSLQQSVGDDSTDVYGGHLSLGTARPLFTTTTTRPRLVPFTSILAARQKLQQHIQRTSGIDSEHETTIEASTGRVFDHENVVTTNPVPLVYIPTHRDRADERLYQQPIYHRQYPNVQFRTTEYLRDNPGAPIPIGNQRPYVNLEEYRNQRQETDPQFLRDTTAQPVAATTKSVPLDANTPAPYGLRPVTRIIPIAVDERGVPIKGYRFAVNPFEAPPSPAPASVMPPFIPPVTNDMQSITTPVSTQDLKRLLHVLLIRQNRLQALMDEVSNPGPPYRSLPLYREPDIYDRDYSNKHEAYPAPPSSNPAYQNYVQPRQYNRLQPAHEPPQYNNYRPAYDQPAYSRQQVARQQELFTNQISGYESGGQYESQRFVPRRRLYARPQYDQSPRDTDGANSDRVSDTPSDYLPADVREALLLKMLMLAISPEYVPVPRGGSGVPPDAAAPGLLTELTAAAPAHRKQVRNVQILGEEGSKDDMKRRAMQTH